MGISPKKISRSTYGQTGSYKVENEVTKLILKRRGGYILLRNKRVVLRCRNYPLVLVVTSQRPYLKQIPMTNPPQADQTNDPLTAVPNGIITGRPGFANRYDTTVVSDATGLEFTLTLP